jgi:hypothetical protein
MDRIGEGQDQQQRQRGQGNAIGQRGGLHGPMIPEGSDVYNQSRKANQVRRCIMFDSPIERCPVCGEMVLLDQTQCECSREHHCSKDTVCPLGKYFTGIDFSVVQSKEILRDKGF